jgi:hypothetical protein
MTLTGWWCNNHLEKYEFVNGKDDIPYMTWKIQFMFQTTNQILMDSIVQWIGLRENLHQKSLIIPLNMGDSCKPIH